MEVSEFIKWDKIMKKNNQKSFRRKIGIRKLGSFYLCHNCREVFRIYEQDEVKCPTCGNEKKEEGDES